MEIMSICCIDDVPTLEGVQSSDQVIILLGCLFYNVVVLEKLFEWNFFLTDRIARGSKISSNDMTGFSGECLNLWK